MNEKYSHQVCWIWLVMSLGVGNPLIWEYVNQHRTIEETCRFVQSDKNVKKKNIIEVQLAKQLLVDCLKSGIQVVCYSDTEYPESLRDIHNPPCVIFYKGNLGLLNCERLLTVVGTRKPSDYTIMVTNQICNNLVKEGYVLISGFALGVDSIANKCCINNNRPTICVLASGINYDYPKENIFLKEQVLVKGGLILTEQLPDTKPYRSNFPKRNRILAGLGRGTLVTEASLGSGALITANYTYKQGKPLFCVPPADIFDNRYLGVVKYIRDGAICIFSHNDILYEYYGSYPVKVRQTDIIEINNAEKVSESVIFKEENVKESKKVSSKTVKKAEKSSKVEELVLVSNIINENQSKNTDVSMNDNKDLVVQSLKKGYKYLDDIANDTNIDISELFEIITELEIDGIIKADFGNAYTLI